MKQIDKDVSHPKLEPLLKWLRTGPILGAIATFFTASDLPWIIEWTHLTMKEFVLGGLTLFVTLFLVIDNFYQRCLNSSANAYANKLSSQWNGVNDELKDKRILVKETNKELADQRAANKEISDELQEKRAEIRKLNDELDDRNARIRGLNMKLSTYVPSNHALLGLDNRPLVTPKNEDPFNFGE